MDQTGTISFHHQKTVERNIPPKQPRFSRIFAACVLAAVSVSFAQPAAAIQSPSQLNAPGVPLDAIGVTTATLPPMAHVRFCIEYPKQCAKRASRLDSNLPRNALFAQLGRINQQINAAISPKADGVYRGLQDEWRINVSQGDCEDFALQKRKLLLDMGWSSSSLRIATALTTGGVGHAVLIARILGKDYVLDNLSAELRHWNTTGYKFLKIQSPNDPKLWLSVERQDTRIASVS